MHDIGLPGPAQRSVSKRLVPLVHNVSKQLAKNVDFVPFVETMKHLIYRVVKICHPIRKKFTKTWVLGRLPYFWRGHENRLYLWSPWTAEYKRSPRLPVSLDAGYGFGYNQNSNDYEVVRIVSNYDSLRVDS
ncbi:hypothetical protein IFM89_019661 [Coptis chinensis]|uniref:Uncharacterized protein n=1 Tax=Coptis chinensis TaxID=261450 RepID=A0A835I2C4_9MAGN|nr:hypothetical protein IFM89_019661 [Coptis chinensis]